MLLQPARLRQSGALLLWLVVAVSLVLVSAPAAQEPKARPIVAASGRASTSVSFDGRLMGGGTVWLNRSTSHSGLRPHDDRLRPAARTRSICWHARTAPT